MKFIVGLICIFFSIKAFPESIYYKVVAQDGSGDYLTIQEAVNSVLVYQEQRSVIKVKPGIYREKLVIPAAWCNCRKRSIPTHSERLNPLTIIAKMALKSA